MQGCFCYFPSVCSNRCILTSLSWIKAQVNLSWKTIFSRFSLAVVIKQQSNNNLKQIVDFYTYKKQFDFLTVLILILSKAKYCICVTAVMADIFKSTKKLQKTVLKLLNCNNKKLYLITNE